MPFKREGRPTYYIGPYTTAGIDIPRMSTGTTNRRTAIAIEAMIRDLPQRGYGDLVQRVVAGSLDLAVLYATTLEEKSDERLTALRNQESDRLLSEVVGKRAEFEMAMTTDGEAERRVKQPAIGLYAVISDERTRTGLDQLLALAPTDARLSWLRQPRNITALYDQALQGGHGGPRKPNSVRRSLHRAVSEVLARELGRGQMLSIMADVKVPHQQDERVVLLSPDEITRVLGAADPQFRPVIGLAVTTGIDRGAARATRVRHYDAGTGTLVVIDGKTTSRPRTLILRGEPVLENAEYWLTELVAGRASHEPLVDLTDRQIRTRWEAVREVIKRPDVRWKDLRGVFATYYLQAGGEPRDLQHILGHSAMAMTLRYLRRVPAGNKDRLRQAARRVGQPPADWKDE